MYDNEKNRRQLVESKTNFYLDSNADNPDIVSNITLASLTITSKDNPDDKVTARLERILDVYSNLNGEVPQQEKDELRLGIEGFGEASHLAAQQMIFSLIKKYHQKYTQADKKIEELFNEYKSRAGLTQSPSIEQYESSLAERQNEIKAVLEELRHDSTNITQVLDKVITVCQKFEDLNYQNSCKVNESAQNAERYIVLVNQSLGGKVTLTTIADAKNHARNLYVNERYQKQVLQNWKRTLPDVDILTKRLDDVQRKQEVFLYAYKHRLAGRSKEEKILD